MTGTPNTTSTDGRVEVLAAVRAARAAELAAAAGQLELAVQWAGMHSADALDEAAAVRFGEVAVPVAGPGAPLVGEFCIAEFAAALGLSTDAGRDLIGEGVELAHRLPKLYARVRAGQLPAWRARRVARATLHLSVDAAGFVDTHLAPVAHKVGTVTVDKLVAEAIARFMPDTAQEIAARAADGRCFVVDHRQVSFAGTSRVHGELDLAPPGGRAGASPQGRAPSVETSCVGHRVSTDTPRPGLG